MTQSEILILVILAITVCIVFGIVAVVVQTKLLPTLNPAIAKHSGAELLTVTPPTATWTPVPTSTSTPTPTDTRPPTATNTRVVVDTLTPTPTVCGPPAGWVLYTVQVNDTLPLLASKTNTTEEQLRQANCLADSFIVAGQPLYLPFTPPPPTATITPTPVSTATPSLTPSPTSTVGQPATPTPKNTPSETSTPTDTAMPAEDAPTPTPTSTSTFTPTPTSTATPKPTSTPTLTPIPSDTVEPVPAPGPSDPALTVSPDSAPSGTTFTISIEEFEPNETIIVVVTFLDASEIVFFVEGITADNEGNAAVSYASQTDSPEGRYLAEAFGEQSFAAQEFIIVDSDPPVEDTPTPTPTLTSTPTPTSTDAPTPTNTPSLTPTPGDNVEAVPEPDPSDPALTVSPDSAPSGTTFTISIEEFEPNETIIVVVTFLDTSEIVFFVEGITADIEGNAAVSYASQTDSPGGRYPAEAFGEQSFAARRFIITNSPFG